MVMPRSENHCTARSRKAVQCSAFFDRQDLAVCDAAVRVDHAVHIVVADPLLAGAVARFPAVRAPSAATRDAAQFLRIDVHELTGPGSLDPPDDPTGWPIDLPKPVQAPPDQHPMHCRGVHPHDAGDACRSELAAPTQSLDPLLEPSERLVRTPVRTTRAIPQARIALRLPVRPPLIDRRPRHIHHLRDLTHRPAREHPFDKISTGKRSAWRSRDTATGASCGLVCAWYSHLLAEAPTHGGPVNNEDGQNKGGLTNLSPDRAAVPSLVGSI